VNETTLQSEQHVSNRCARKIVLPRFTLTEVSDATDGEATRIGNALEPYYCRPKLVPAEGKRRDGNPKWVKHQFNLFPLILDATGAPWAEAVIYLLSRLENALAPSMATYAAIAEDLATYRRFLDEYEIDWTDFPLQKLQRPTYRFNGHLKHAMSAAEIAPATAKRRMGSVITFYRWLENENVFKPAQPPWRDSDRYVQFLDGHGFRRSKTVVTTDLSICIPKQRDPYDGFIEDDGKLRPLPIEEQEWLLDALVSLGNTEMTLIHLFSLLTGARIQTALTFRLRHALLELEACQQGDLRFPVGHGTGVDTKRQKQIVLHIPIWFYQSLQTYARSARAARRRERAVGGDHENQYLFLSQRGAPFYQGKLEALSFDRSNQLRHRKCGQGVRQFITERVIPFVHAKHRTRTFHYQFHDMRATAGMNWTDHQLRLVELGQSTLHQAREFVKTRLSHESSATTDRYLQYRHNVKLTRWAEEQHETHLKALCERAMERLN
jgi:integrase